MIRKVRTSTITVPLMSMTPAVPVVTRKLIPVLLARDVGEEDEAEREVDEVHRLDETDDREQPRDHPALRFGLPRDAADERVACKSVTEGCPDGAETDREAESDEGSRENQSVVCHVFLLMVFVLDSFARHA